MLRERNLGGLSELFLPLPRGEIQRGSEIMKGRLMAQCAPATGKSERDLTCALKNIYEFATVLFILSGIPQSDTFASFLVPP